MLPNCSFPQIFETFISSESGRCIDVSSTSFLSFPLHVVPVVLLFPYQPVGGVLPYLHKFVNTFLMIIIL
jgi:hypothetical protein